MFTELSMEQTIIQNYVGICKPLSAFRQSVYQDKASYIYKAIDGPKSTMYLSLDILFTKISL